jgi:hypothetical protein
LSIGNAPGGYFSSKPSLTYRVWDVATSVDALTATNTGQIGIFDDLGSGVEFGERIVSSADNGIQVLIPLSGNAIVGPLGLNNPTHLIAFGGSIDVSPVSPVPEPTTLLLLGTTGGLGFLARWRLRLRKKGIGRAEME